jgi:hypothetical protein
MNPNASGDYRLREHMSGLQGATQSSAKPLKSLGYLGRGTTYRVHMPHVAFYAMPDVERPAILAHTKPPS